MRCEAGEGGEGGREDREEREERKKRGEEREGGPDLDATDDLLGLILDPPPERAHLRGDPARARGRQTASITHASLPSSGVVLRAARMQMYKGRH